MLRGGGVNKKGLSQGGMRGGAKVISCAGVVLVRTQSKKGGQATGERKGHYKENR